MAAFYARASAALNSIPNIDWEIIISDNASVDGTEAEIRKICATDKRIKLICNARNFGHIRSPANSLFNASGDAVITMASDLQDPPEKIVDFVTAWQNGHKIVIAKRTESKESLLFSALRKTYYFVLDKISQVKQISGFTGFGLYDRKVVELMRQMAGSYPYIRGMIGEIGIKPEIIQFPQPARSFGVTKNNFNTLFDLAILGMTSQSAAPMRIAVYFGLGSSIVSMLIAATYLLIKIIWWNNIQFGTAPILIGMFFFGSVQLFFLGLIGEYIASMHLRMQNKPLVVERERVNF